MLCGCLPGITAVASCHCQSPAIRPASRHAASRAACVSLLKKNCHQYYIRPTLAVQMKSPVISSVMVMRAYMSWSLCVRFVINNMNLSPSSVNRFFTAS